MGQEALVDGENSLGLNCLSKTIEYTFVKIAVLVVHAGHDGIYSGISPVP